MALRIEELAKTIDCTLLGPRAGLQEVEAVCQTARELHLASLCVLPKHVGAAAEHLRGSDVKVCAVVGYPEGGAAAKAKIAEAERCLDEGAGELEFALDVRAMLALDFALVRDELTAFARTIRMRPRKCARRARASVRTARSPKRSVIGAPTSGSPEWASQILGRAGRACNGSGEITRELAATSQAFAPRRATATGCSGLTVTRSVCGKSRSYV